VAVYGSIFARQLEASVAQALSVVFVTAAPIAAIGLLVVLFLEERPLRQQTASPSLPAESSAPPGGAPAGSKAA
jgi:hypothetical protein